MSATISECDCYLDTKTPASELCNIISFPKNSQFVISEQRKKQTAGFAFF